MAAFILAIDGGGTKTIARLIDINSHKQWQATAGAASLTNNFNGAVAVIEYLSTELLAQSNCQPLDVTAVFGLAGAGDETRANNFAQHFQARFNCLKIFTDAETSAYGANNGNEVAVVALGTGSVGMRLQKDDGGELISTLVGGWGFILDDEGGGAKLGLHGIRACLSEIQRFGYCESQLAKVITENIGESRADILNWTASAKPADFAIYAPMFFALHQDCPVAKKLLSGHIKHVEYLIANTRAGSNLPMVLLGGLAKPTQQLLSIATQKNLQAPSGTALDGACILAMKTYEDTLKNIKR